MPYVKHLLKLSALLLPQVFSVTAHAGGAGSGGGDFTAVSACLKKSDLLQRGQNIITIESALRQCDASISQTICSIRFISSNSQGDGIVNLEQMIRQCIEVQKENIVK